MRSLSMGQSGRPVVRWDQLEFRFERAESAFELVLSGGLLAGRQEFGARRRRLFGAEGFAAAGCAGIAEVVGLGPEAFAGEEVVLHAGAGELLHILVAEVIVESGAEVLMGDIDAADAFIV